jgi:hypothetical protein
MEDEKRNYVCEGCVAQAGGVRAERAWNAVEDFGGACSTFGGFGLEAPWYVRDSGDGWWDVGEGGLPQKLAGDHHIGARWVVCVGMGCDARELKFLKFRDAKFGGFCWLARFDDAVLRS